MMGSAPTRVRIGLPGVIGMVFTRRTATTTRPRTGWPTAVERFARAVHRFSDRIEVIPDRGLRAELRDLGTVLGTALADVRQSPRGRASPRGQQVRGVENALAVRAVLRAGTLCAQATEAAVLAATASRSRRPDDVARHVETVRALTVEIRELADSCRITPDH